jgi:molecular chaperone GrpE
VPDDEKGKFSAEIDQDVIEAALKSVAKRTDGVEVAVDGAPTLDTPAEAASPEDPKDQELETLKAQLEFSMAKGRETLEKLKEEHERLLRGAADLENLRKRAVKEKEEVQRFGQERLLRDFLPVIDNLDRALEHAATAADFESFKKGVAMTRKLFEDTLGKQGVRSFTAVGQPFDPRLHEAMQQVESTSVPPNQVVSELVRGYTLNDRLMRPALVAVSKAPPQPPQPASAPDVKPDVKTEEPGSES